MNSITVNRAGKLAKELIEDHDPGIWINWLFDMQNLMISTGACESLTRKGSEELSGKFASLKSFFQDMQIPG